MMTTFSSIDDTVYFKQTFESLRWAGCCNSSSLRLWCCSFTESIPESPVDFFQMPHTSSPSSITPFGLSTPVILSLAFSRISTFPAGRLLKMVGLRPAPAAQSVSLVAALAKGGCSLGKMGCPLSTGTLWLPHVYCCCNGGSLFQFVSSYANFNCLSLCQ